MFQKKLTLKKMTITVAIAEPHAAISIAIMHACDEYCAALLYVYIY